MTVEQWLEGRPHRPPAVLAEAIRAALPPLADRAQSALSPQLIAGVNNLVPEVLAGECRARAGALPLLALDALLTYAMESASGTAEECERAAAEALGVIGGAAASLEAKPPARS